MRGIFWTIIYFSVLVSSFASPETAEVPKNTTVIRTTTVHSTTTTLRSTTTTIPSTTTMLPNTTTTIPSTTTMIPNTTTTIPSTTTMIPNTTTPAPSTTTSVPSTTTNFPSSTQPIDEFKWNVTDHNVTCIIAEIRAEFSITQGNLTVAVPLPSNAVADPSTCEQNTSQVLALSFENDILEFVFEKDSDTVSVKKIKFVTNIGGIIMEFSNGTKLFSTKFGNSYMCRSTEYVPLNNSGMAVSITLKIESIQLQAFRTELGFEFGNADECAADEIISDIVPIAVACALAILIVIVLIAYLVGRRRLRQKGYTSV